MSYQLHVSENSGSGWMCDTRMGERGEGAKGGIIFAHTATSSNLKTLHFMSAR